jgi:beta-glucosidase
MQCRRPFAASVRLGLGVVLSVSLGAALVGTACVTPGGRPGTGSGSGAADGGVYIPPASGGSSMGGAGNETVISGNGGMGGDGNGGAGGGATSTGGAPVKMACSAPTTNYPYSPGYVISPAAVSMAESAVSSMTLSDRADQLRGTKPGAASSRQYNDIFRTLDAAGIKGFKFRDGPRGVNLAAENPSGKQGYSTTFPVASARGASFDLTLEYQIGQALGDEMVASNHNMLLAPTTNILRHPLWGRSQETYGEDSFHLGRMGTANVVGVQEYVPACAKHYAANNIEVNRANLNAMMDEQTLQEVYARHFGMMIRDGGVSCIMAAYNSVNGVKSTQNGHLLNELLRGQFGFQGFVLSDWWAMPGGAGNITTDQQKANATQALQAGMDMELPWGYNYSQIESQVTSNAIAQTTVNEAATRVVREKFRFNIATGTGLKAALTTLTAQNSIAGNDPHIELARQAAVEGSVLLKNDDKTLPIVQPGRTVSSVVVIGAKVPWSITGSGLTQKGTLDFANDIRIGDLGSSRVLPDPAKTIGPTAGLRAAAPTGVTVTSSDKASAAADADFIVVVAGMTQQDEGEEYTGEADRNNFSLDGKVTGTKLQDKLITDVAQIAKDKNKPMVVVLQGGGIIDMPWISMVPAVVMAWYPGQVGGYAIGQLLFGTANFSGKLPVTWSTVAADWPVFSVTGDTTTMMSYYLGYRWFDKMKKTPLYPFGHGLSYTTYRYENVTVPCNDVKPTANIPVTVDVFNTGDVDGDEVVMVFARFLDADAPPAGVQRSVKELKAFRRVNLPKGQGKRVTIDVRASDLAAYDPASNTMKVPTGKVQLLVGPSSDRTKLLPASDTDTSTVITLVP